MKYIFLMIASLLFLSCSHPSEISKEFHCNTAGFKNLEKVDDLKNVFSIPLPKNWKINLYQDETQSSIFAADTTKQLTETVLIDVTLIQNKINFNTDFLLQQEQENLAKGLIKMKSNKITMLKKPSIYMVYKGKKGTFNYQTCHTFIKLNEQNFLLVKTAIYGDSLVDERFCSSFYLIEKIQLNQ